MPDHHRDSTTIYGANIRQFLLLISSELIISDLIDGIPFVNLHFLGFGEFPNSEWSWIMHIFKKYLKANNDMVMLIN